MSKIGRDRKGRSYQAKRTGWKPAEIGGEVRYQIIRKKSKNGVEYVTYKPIILLKG